MMCIKSDWYVLPLILVAVLSTMVVVAYSPEADSQVDYTAQIQQVHWGGETVSIDASGAYVLFNSGATGTSYSGNDLYVRYYSSTDTVAIAIGSFSVNKNYENAILTILAYDVDEERTERDVIFLRDDTDGTLFGLTNQYLHGSNNSWSTSTLTIDGSLLTPGHTYTVVNVETVNGWEVWIREVSIQFAGDPYTVDLTASMDGSTLSLSMSGTITEGNYQIEYGVYRVSDLNHIVTVESSLSVGPDKVFSTSKSISLSGVSSGEYRVDALLRKGGSLSVSASCVFSINGYSVNYNSNGGSNNVPEGSSYVYGEVVLVSFSKLPSLEHYRFLGWSTDKNSVVPEYSSNGTSSFVITSNVVLYAVWEYVGHELELIEVIEPTCETSGCNVYVCHHCQERLESVIPALGHLYLLVESEEADCFHDGHLAYSCERCGDAYSVITHVEHDYQEVYRTEPTCISEGHVVYACSKCGDAFSVTIPAEHRYVPQVIKRATEFETGILRYTCESCGDSYDVVLPVKKAGLDVLLIQDRIPWEEDNNVLLLGRLVTGGYIDGWDIVTSGNVSAVALNDYDVVMIADDQLTPTYSRLGDLDGVLTGYVEGGGVLVYGACDRGWGAGEISYNLPGGVVKVHGYLRNNYVVDRDSPVVTGVLTDGRPLTDGLLHGRYCSHSSFEPSSIPGDYNVIIADGNGRPTLVEYGIGAGTVIASGLTWEFYLQRYYEGPTTYSMNAFDDLIVYAASLSGGYEHHEHAFTLAETVLPGCETAGYTVHRCECGHSVIDSYVAPTGHDLGPWTTVKEATCIEDGSRSAICYVCGETVTESVPATGHVLVHHDAKEPTYDESGWTEYYECTVCGFSTFHSVPRLYRTIVSVDLPVVVTIPEGSLFDALDLPSSLDALTSDGVSLSIRVVWDSGSFSSAIGVHSMSGTITAPEGFILGVPSTVEVGYVVSGSLIPVGTEFVQDGLRYRVTSAVPAEVSVIGYDGTKVDVVISSKVRLDRYDYTVRSIGYHAFYGSTIRSVEFPGTLISIGDRSFETCHDLLSVTIPDSVTSIGDTAFNSCYSLGYVSIPDSVESLGYGVFSSCLSLERFDGTSRMIMDDVALVSGGRLVSYAAGCESSSYDVPDFITIIGASAFETARHLESVSIPTSVESIESCAFESCYDLVSISIPDSVDAISYRAFENCFSLISVQIPLSVTAIADQAFSHCAALAYVDIPSSVTSIGAMAFFNCPSLSNVIIPDSVVYIGYGAFSGCPSLKGFGGSYSGIVDGIMLVSGNELVSFAAGAEASSIRLPQVRSVSSYAFEECGFLKTVIIPDSVESIGYDAFIGCSSLESVDLGSVVSIGDLAFAECHSLRSVSIPESVGHIGTGAFSGCSIEYIKYDASEIEDLFPYSGVFRSSYAQRVEISFGDSVRAVPANLFNCDGMSALITSISFSTSIESIGEDAFSGLIFYDDAILSYWDLPGSMFVGSGDGILYRIGGGFQVDGFVYETESVAPFIVRVTGFERADSNVTVPSSTVLHGCPAEVASVSDASFQGSSLESVTVSARTISSYAFSGCSSLREVILMEGVESIGYRAFEGCPIERIVFPDSLEEVGRYAFYGSSFMAEGVMIEQTAENLSGREFRTVDGALALYGASEGAQFTAGGARSMVSSEGAYVSGCPAGSIAVRIPGTVSFEGSTFDVLGVMDGAFANTGIVSLTLESGAIANYAFSGCSSLKTVVLEEGVTSVGYRSFENCTALDSISFPGSLSSIGKFAFYGNTFTVGGTKVDQTPSMLAGHEFRRMGGGLALYGTDVGAQFESNGLRYMVKSPFEAWVTGSRGIAAVVIPELVSFQDKTFYVQGILDGAFAGTQVESVTLSAGRVANYAFSECESLREVVLCEGVTSIGYRSFDRCVGMESLSLPESLESIGKYAFYGIRFFGPTGSALKQIPSDLSGHEFVAGKNARMFQQTIPYGSEFSVDGLTYRITSLSPLEASVVGLEGATSSVHVPSTVVQDGYAVRVVAVGQSVFEGSSIEEVFISEGVRSIGYRAFADCSSLSVIYVPFSVTDIGKYAFSGLRFYSDGIKLVQDPESLAGHLFVGSGSRLNASDISLGYEFEDDGLVYRVSSMAPLVAEVVGFVGCPESVVVSSSVVHDGVSLSVSRISELAFQGCESLESLVVEEGVTSIGYRAFDGCVSLTHVSLPLSLEDIGKYAFSGLTFYSGGVKLVQDASSLAGKVFQGIGNSRLFEA